MALAGGSEAWASHRTPTCPALSGSLLLSNAGAARAESESLNVLERTDTVRVKNCTKTVAKSDSTVRTWAGSETQTAFFFQRPRRNTSPLTTASVENATIIATNTPRGPICAFTAST